MPPNANAHLKYIDCLRGYAILMVITCHLTYLFPNLPYPVHRVMVSGWFGVQLFFLASCITLLMSWHFEIADRGKPDIISFFIRRFFRIAPIYYSAAIFYYFFSPPELGFNGGQLLTSLAFINAWHPDWMPTVSHEWSVVPGGWSIGVEFTFYLLFPIFATWATSLSRAIFIFVASVIVGVICNVTAIAMFGNSFQPQEFSNFLFFWFPNQMSVFAFGGIAYFLLARIGSRHWRYFPLLQRHCNLAALSSVIVFLSLTYLPLGHFLGDARRIPASLAVCIPLVGFIFALSTGHGIFVNRFAAAMGQVSFSAYTIHWAILDLVGRFLATLRPQDSGYSSVVAFTAALLGTVPIIYLTSKISYRIIEQPMINFGKLIIKSRREVVYVKTRLS